MGILTNFLKLLKPEPNDFVDVAKHISENYDKLDKNAETTNQTLTNLNNSKLDKGTYPGKASDLNTEISKIASTTQLGRIIVGDNLTIDKAGRLSGNPAVDISGKLDKYKSRHDIKDYDDLTEDGFYILTGNEGYLPSTNAPYRDPALVQVWSYGDFIYQNAVSYYNVECQYTRCFLKEVKNTKWERIVNTANYSSMCPYSIGDILLTVSNQNPAVKWVGTIWEKIEGRFLLGSNASYSLGSTGGTSTITLTEANIPRHRHQVDTVSATIPEHTHNLNITRTNEDGYQNGQYVANGTSNEGNMIWTTSSAGGGSTGAIAPYTSYVGSGTTFNNMPPYLVINIWKRLS